RRVPARLRPHLRRERREGVDPAHRGAGAGTRGARGGSCRDGAAPGRAPERPRRAARRAGDVRPHAGRAADAQRRERAGAGRAAGGARPAAGGARGGPGGLGGAPGRARRGLPGARVAPRRPCGRPRRDGPAAGPAGGRGGPERGEPRDAGGAPERAGRAARGAGGPAPGPGRCPRGGRGGAALRRPPPARARGAGGGAGAGRGRDRGGGGPPPGVTPVTAAQRNGGQAAEALPPAPVDRDPAAAPRALGELLVREGLITDAQLAAALAACEARPGAVSLEEVLLEDGAVSRADLERVRSRYRRRDRLGDLLVAAGVVSDGQLQLAVDHHLRTGLRLGDALLQLGFLTEDALRQTLSRQLGIGFVDLDRLVLDRRLAPAIPKEYAERHRVLPVAEGDGLLTIAVADPTDAGLAEDLAAVTGARVRLVTSTPAAFQRAFARIYGEDPAVGLARQQHRLEQAYAAVSAELDAGRRALAALQEAQDDVLREQGEALRAAAARSEAQAADEAAREAA